MLILLDLVHCRSPVEEDPEWGEAFSLPFCLGQLYGWSEVCDFSYGFVSSATFWFNPPIFHLGLSRFLSIYAYMIFDENTSGQQRNIEVCNIQSTQ
jgi:hypothetical protein